jgi:hypothetical protein
LNARPDSTADVLWRKADGAVGFWSLEGTEFGSETTIAQPVGSNYRVEAIGDLSGDGTEDILWRDTTTNDVAIWLMESKTFKTAEFLTFKVDQSWQVHGIADFDGDGKGDVVWRHKGSQSFAMWYMDGTAIKGSKVFSGIDNAWDIKGTGDFNGDGKAEILWRNTTDNRVAMGSVTATSHAFTDMKYGGVNVLVGQDFTVEAIADFGGDGKSDILWRNTAGNIAVWEMNGSVIANPNMVKAPGTDNAIVIPVADWGIVGAEYLGNDNRADILWRNKQDGKWAVWQMNSATLQTGSFLKEVATWQDLSKTPAGMAGRPAAIDEAGNTTATAFNVGSLTTQASFQGAVDAWDQSDVYAFTLNGAQMVRISLNGMGARSENENLNLQVVKWDNTLLGKSENLRNQAEDVLFSGTTGETYYVKVMQAGVKDFNEYRLSFEILGNLSLSKDTDTGTSNADSITQKNKPVIQGEGPVGGTIRVYETGIVLSGNSASASDERLLGSVTIGASKQWVLQLPELMEGNHSLVARLLLIDGREQQLSNDLQVTIDTKSPELQLPELSDGIAWSEVVNGLAVSNQKSLSGDVFDRDNLTKVEYKFANIQAPAKSLEVSNGKINGTLTIPAGIKAFTEQTVIFRTWDRAGNERTQEYQFMVTDDNAGLESSDIETNLLADDPTVRAGLPKTSGANGRSLYIGNNGEWGYWGSGTGGAGGTGSNGWSWQPDSTFSPSTWDGYGDNGAPDPNERLNYITAVSAITDMAYKILSNSSKIRQKKEQMGREIDDLKDLAQFVQKYGLYSAMGGTFHGVLKTAFDGLSNGTMSRKQASVMGFDLAKAIAKDTLQVSWKAFHAEVWATMYQALNLGSVSVDQQNKVQQAMTSLSQTYYKTVNRPYDGYSEYYNDGFLQDLSQHRLYEKNSSGEFFEGRTLKDLAARFANQTSPERLVDALQMANRLLQAGRQVTGLYNPVPDGSGATYIQQREFVVNGLTSLAFEIARINPIVIPGSNPASKWIETLVEGRDTIRWTSGEIKAVASGLSKWFEGYSSDRQPLHYSWNEALFLAVDLLANSSKINSYKGIYRDVAYVQAQIELAHQYVIAPNDSSSDYGYIGSLWSNKYQRTETRDSLAANREYELTSIKKDFIEYTPLADLAFYNTYDQAVLALKSTSVAANGGYGLAQVADTNSFDLPISDRAQTVSRLTSVVKVVARKDSQGNVRAVDPVTGKSLEGNSFEAVPAPDGRWAVLSKLNITGVLKGLGNQDYQIVRTRADGGLTVFDQDEIVSLKEGDKLFFPAITPLQAEVLSKEITAIYNLKPPLGEAYNYWRNLSYFISGAVYEYLFNVVADLPLAILDILVPWESEKRKGLIGNAENNLPDNDFFKIGRLAGAGGAILQGINEFINGIRSLGPASAAFAASWAGGPPVGAVGTGVLLADVVAIAHGAAVASLGTKRFVSILQDLYDRLAIKKELDKSPIVRPEQLTPEQQKLIEPYVELKVDRKKELKDIEKQIKNAKQGGMADDSEELLELRYRRYLINKVDAGKSPLSPDEWLKSEGIVRQNRTIGGAAQENVLNELGIQDNNQLIGTQRASYTEVGIGSTIPDASTSKAWIDIKSVNTQDGVLNYTQQLRLQKLGTQAAPHAGKKLVVIMTGKNPVRPSAPLARDATVLKFNETTKTWSLWNNTGKGKWDPNSLSLNDVKQLLGN